MSKTLATSVRMQLCVRALSAVYEYIHQLLCCLIVASQGSSNAAALEKWSIITTGLQLSCQYAPTDTTNC